MNSVNNMIDAPILLIMQQCTQVRRIYESEGWGAARDFMIEMAGALRK